MTLSVVVPVYNEVAGLELFHSTQLMPALKSLGQTYEIVYVDDGSTDGTHAALGRIASARHHVRVVTLSRNFGKELAMTAGLATARGDAVVVMDADGQHPPALLASFLEKWQAGAKVVVGIWQTQQHEGLLKKWGSKAYYQFFSQVGGLPTVPHSTDFRLLDRVVVQEFLRFSERNRLTRGLIDWLGFQRAYVAFDAPARLAGEATYKPRQLARLAMHSLVALSLKPLFALGWVGLSVTVLSFVFGAFMFVEQFLLDDPLKLNFSGSALLGILIAFLVGLVLLSQGVLALYIATIHDQTQGRPLYVIDSMRSFNIENEQAE